MHKRKIIIICGAPGVGKTTVANALARDGRTVANIGTMMNELGSSGKYYVKSRDRIRYRSMEVNSRLRLNAARRIRRMHGDVIIDTHASVIAGDKVVSGMPLNFMKPLAGEVSAIIYLDASNAELIARRLKDSDRNRQRQSDLEIDRQRDVNLATLSYYMVTLDIPIYIINNRENKVKDTVKSCEDVIRDLD
jgi:adenylate kinase